MPPQRPQYWCHQCQQEVQVLLAPDPVCQRCNGQFVEQIEPENDPRDFVAPAGEDDPAIGSAPGAYYTFNAGGPNSNIFQFYDGNSNNAAEQPGGGALYGMLQALLSGNLPTPPIPNDRNSDHPSDTGINPSGATAQGGDGGDGTRAGQYRQPVMFMGSFGPDGGVRFRTVQGDSQMPGGFQESPPTGPGMPESPRAGEGRDQGSRTANMINLIQMISGLSGSPIHLNFGGSANPGDYVFSQTGLDNIITQLMEQANSDHAPAPATDEMIDALEKKTLDESDIEKYSHCAICTDDFVKDDEVVTLPCEHPYHKDCITPWLKVNGTCPVCRYSLITGQKPKEDASGNNTANTNASGSNASQAPPSSSINTDPTTTAPPTMNASMSWESSIPGAFVWGPGGDNQSTTNNTDTNANTSTSNNSSSNDNQPGQNNPGNPNNVLDLD
ncbi:hypothetical protein NQZ79_g1560 [Umbelopsis isabellina]|nr:hypothetical protein NQZ79_g1560 [Umbelopsis isabellina]